MQTRVLPISDSSIHEACRILRHGELVAFPTETVYGLGGLGLHLAAIEKIFRVKGRPKTDPLILHLPSPNLATAVASGFVADPLPPLALLLAETFWPGPLTLILPKGPLVPLTVTAGNNTVAVRYPSCPSAQRLLQEVGHPLAAPSANRFGRLSPTDAAAVLAELNGKIPLILDGGPCPQGIESTVLTLTELKPTILRLGAITPERISSVLNQPVLLQSKKISAAMASPSPGMLAQHYSPQTPLYLCTSPIQAVTPEFQFIVFCETRLAVQPNVHLLAPDGKGETAARNLYRFLRQADGCSSAAILIDPIPDSASAPALRDRLERASLGTAHFQDGQWHLRTRA